MSPPRHRFAVAPMLAWTDRYCRSLHRRLSRRALLFTEMVVAEALLHGPRPWLTDTGGVAGPVAFQLGGSDPARLAAAARIVEEAGFDEINLNVGCPSDRVQSGTFGACLMRTPALVGDCVAAMKAAVRVPVTVKCRIGVDDQDPEMALDALADAVLAAGADAIWVHARKAWLEGLSPRENREIPPLDHGRVHRLKARLGGTFIGINGGFVDLGSALAALDHVDGVMLGRAACAEPALLASVDRLFYGEPGPDPDPADIVEEMMPEIEHWLAEGAGLGRIVHPMIGLFHGRPGARAWRRLLSEGAHRPGAGIALVREALARVRTAGSFPEAAPLVSA